MVDRVDNIISNESLISKVDKVDKQIHNHTYIYTYISITSRQVDKVHKLVLFCTKFPYFYFRQGDSAVQPSL